jgi:DNA-binding SARP family transcriptional activator
VRLFGSPQVERNGKPVAFDTRKALALIAYLALAGRQGRDRLATLLWGDADTERARGALRRTLSTVRTAIGDALVTDGLSVELTPGAVDVDVHQFRELLARGRLESAVSAYAGDLLDGFSVRDSPDYEDWQVATRDGLRRELASALDQLSRDAAPREAVAHARRWLALDPLHEPAHRALMRAHARAGDRAAALLQYRECARVLDRELGVAPLPETSALAQAVERGEPEPAPPEPSRSVGVDEAVGDLYTRHGEYARAIASYEMALASAAARDKGRLEHRLAAVYHRRGDWERADAHYRAAARGEDDPGLRARIAADRAVVAHRRGDLPLASRLADDALSLAKRSRDDRALAQAHNIAGILRGDRSHLEESVRLAERIGDAEARVAAMNNLALALGRAGETDRAIALTRGALDLSAAFGDRHREAALHNNLADLLHRAGLKSESMRALKRAVRLFAEIGEDAGREPEVWKLVDWS